MRLIPAKPGWFTTLVMLTSLPALSQPNPAQSNDELRVAEKLPALKPLVEELKRAIEAKDLPATLGALKKFDAGMQELQAELKPTPDQRSAARKKHFLTMEDASSLSPSVRDRVLGLTAIAAEEAGEYAKAKLYATETLASVKHSRNPAQNTYYANHVLGLVALHDGDVAAARAYLLASADVATWPHMIQRGPNLTLARRLLQKGERETVIDFLERCKTLWPPGQSKLVQWQAIIKAGSEPQWDGGLYSITPLP